MRRKARFYALLVLATVGLSRLLAAWRAWRAAPTLEGGLVVAAFGLVVVGAILWLGFVLYEVDRAAGRVRHRVGVYEWILARRVGARRPDLGWPEAPRTRPAGGGR
ncbi:MAG TPA: hypothetical protein VKV57_07240 [bacterium]|nr:hypothetical protein [bacterium]